MGNWDEASIRLKELEELEPNEAKPYRAWSVFYALQNKQEIALDNLEKAVSLGYEDWEWIRTDEALDSLRDHPRFKTLIEKAPDK